MASMHLDLHLLSRAVAAHKVVTNIEESSMSGARPAIADESQA